MIHPDEVNPDIPNLRIPGMIYGLHGRVVKHHIWREWLTEGQGAPVNLV
jgi:hypothetical protein